MYNRRGDELELDFGMNIHIFGGTPLCAKESREEIVGSEETSAVNRQG